MGDELRVSPNRLDRFFSCGIAYRHHYIDGAPNAPVGSAALFGTAIHKAIEHWSLNREQALETLMRSAWLEIAQGTPVRGFLEELDPLVRESRELCAEIRRKRPEVKQPRMTKEWKTSSLSRRLHVLLRDSVKRLNEGSRWTFTRDDQLPALYEESLELAPAYQERYGHLPPSLVTEFAFSVPFRGILLTGVIDDVSRLVDRETGEVVGIGITDYKTYARQPAEHKDWHQLVFYHLAYQALSEQGSLPGADGLPVLCGIDYVRLGHRRYWRMGEADVERLARELDHYRFCLENEVFLPASKNTDPGFCSAGDACCLRSTALVGGCAERVEVAL